MFYVHSSFDFGGVASYAQDERGHKVSPNPVPPERFDIYSVRPERSAAESKGVMHHPIPESPHSP